SDQQTIAHNLHALCRTHHRHKSQGLLQINRNPHDGTTTITTILGQRSTTQPPPLGTRAA
ncbi:MAG: hypothetical protein FWD59_09330, partial [Micrococcales bacterium]|nr:hypothetical protein [Micrococcales bacterium]